MDVALREALIAALQSPEGRAALLGVLREALRPAAPVVPLPNRKLTVRDVAEFASRDPETVRRAIKAKKLRASKPGGSREWLIDPKDMTAWIDAGGRSSAAEVDIEAELQKSLRRARGSGR